MLAVVLMAGCAAPDAVPPEPEPSPAPAVSAPTYTLAIRVSEERPTGPAVGGAHVHVGLLDGEGSLQGSPALHVADADGWVRLTWRQPVHVVVQAVAPDKTAWTVEGAAVAVQDAVRAEGLVVSERDLFLPLYRSTLRFEAQQTWSTVTATPGDAGHLDAVHGTVPLAFPDGLQAAYLQRLKAARVVVSWEETPTARADLAAGLGWNGNVWVEGEPSGQGLVPGPRSAEFAGELPREGRPADLAAALLQATASTRTAVVGDLLVAYDVELVFGDVRPMQLPDPRCHARGNVCSLPWPAPLV